MIVLYDKKKQRVPIKAWVNSIDDIEENCLEQAINLSNLPFVYRHVALMADNHTGFGFPIGGVIATQGVVIPNAVGSDIFCGLLALKTSLKVITTEVLKRIMGEIRKVIPVGFKSHNEAQSETLMPEVPEDCWQGRKYIIEVEYNRALHQLGSLGSGNHFCELQKGSDGHIWIMIHSGSRNLGYKVAKHYNDIAVELNAKWHSKVPKEWKLAFLPLDSEEGQMYLKEMNYCGEFAKANRRLMMNRIIDCFCKNGCYIDTFDRYDISHNYAKMENHFGKNVIVHRKGATLARDNIGIIPGSCGSFSFITKGKGNPDSFYSSSHGAGRVMSRTKAKSELSLKDEIKKLDDQGIIHGIRTQNDLDEAVGSYKDISKVMKNQENLIEVLVTLTPLANIKR